MPDTTDAAGGAGQPTLNTKPLFQLMVEKKASDLFFTTYAPVMIKIDGKIMPVNQVELTPKMVRQAALELMNEQQLEQFTKDLEIDFAISEPGLGRFRINVFHQRGNVAMVLRFITPELPPDCGGVGDYTIQVAEALARSGDVVSLYVPPAMTPGRAPDGLEVVTLADRFGGRSRRQLSRRLDADGHGRLLVQYVPAVFGRRGTNVPFCRWLLALRHAGAGLPGGACRTP